jgi:hypothetical protein
VTKLRIPPRSQQQFSPIGKFMEKFWPLIDGFFLAGALSGIFFFLCWWLWAGPRRIRSAVEGRLGPSAIQGCIHTSAHYWLVVVFMALLLAVILGILFWKYLGWWLYEDAFQGTWQSWLAYKLNAAFWVITTTMEGIDYAFKVPMGTLLAVFLGIVAGVWVGTKLGRLAAAKEFLITSLMS